MFRLYLKTLKQPVQSLHSSGPGPTSQAPPQTLITQHAPNHTHTPAKGLHSPKGMTERHREYFLWYSTAGGHRFCPEGVLQAAGDPRALVEKIPRSLRSGPWVTTWRRWSRACGVSLQKYTSHAFCGLSRSEFQQFTLRTTNSL